MAYKIDQAVGYNLKRQRLAQGLTQDALGKLAGMTKQGISNIESGKGATSKTITTIADCLHISPFDLYKEIEPEANINFRRVTSPNRIYFNKEQYSEDIRAMIDNIISDTKDEIYYKAVVPVTKEFDKKNREELLARLEVSRSLANYNLLSIYLEELLSNIRKFIYDEDTTVNKLTDKEMDRKVDINELIDTDKVEEIVAGKEVIKSTQDKQTKNKSIKHTKIPHNINNMSEEELLDWIFQR